MLTANQAKLLLSHSEPHILHDSLTHHPISPNAIHITDGTLRRLGISPDALKSYPWYDGAEHVAKGNVSTVVHVFEKDGLEQYSGASWDDYEEARRDVANRVNGFSANGHLHPLSTEQALAQVIHEDMQLNQKWRLTPEARIELVKLLQEHGKKTGHAR